MTVNADRQSVLKALGSAALLGGVAAAGARLPGDERPSGRLRKRGFPPLSNPAGEYTEADVRSDGRYGVVGSYFGRGGSFLVDLADPTNPTGSTASPPVRPLATPTWRSTRATGCTTARRSRTPRTATVASR